MKPRPPDWRPTVVRTLGAVAVAVSVVAGALVVAGCSSGGSRGSGNVSSNSVAGTSLHPATEQVPSTVTGATVVRRTGVIVSPPPPTVVTIHVGADVARHIAMLLNALTPEPPGSPDAGGGADITITVTFDGDPSKTQYVVAGSFYDAVTVSAPSQALPTLSNAGDLDNYLEGLFSLVE